MSIFSSILEKLGIQKPEAPQKTVTPAKTVPPERTMAPARPAEDISRGAGPRPANREPMETPITVRPVEIPMVDVVAKLDRLAKEGPIQGLNWRMSIHDLLALLGLDHSSAGIKELAVELGCPESEMGDSYKRNVWSHKELLRRIAANGGNIPEKLLH